MGLEEKLHTCEGTDDDGRPLAPEKVSCPGCGLEWCERCDPAPSALCHTCHGRGYSDAPMNSIGHRQRTAGRERLWRRMGSRPSLMTSRLAAGLKIAEGTD
jgi:hypothetical protein